MDLLIFTAQKTAQRAPESGVITRFSPSSGEPTLTGIRSYSWKSVSFDRLLLPAGI